MPVADPEIQPGIKSEGTPASSRGRWVDGNLIRWYAGSMRPIGGWSRAYDGVMTGKPRAAFSWCRNTLSNLVAVGTSSRLYVITPSSFFDISPTDLLEGYSDSVTGIGYGVDYYDQGRYGTPRDEGIIKQATTWSFANFGEWLLAVNTTDGRLLLWTGVPVTAPAVAVPVAPTNNQGVAITPQRHVLLYGAGGDKRKLHWSSAETIDVWSPSATNSAGFLIVPSSEAVLAVKQYRNGMLVFTESSLYVMNYIGYPYIYNLSLISNSSSIVSPHVAVYVGSSLVWMGHDKFYTYDGNLKEIPCEVRDFVFSELNKMQAVKSFGFHYSRFGEVWWFFPSIYSTENDRYVVWNYKEGVWYTGYLDRSAGWYTDSWSVPYLVSRDGILYKHETGWTANGQPLRTQRYVVSSPILLREGEQHLLVQGIVPDRDPSNAVGFVLESTGWPEEGSGFSTGVLSGSPYINCRFQSRSFRVKIVGIVDTDWEMGPFKFDVIPTGRRR